MTTQTTTVTTGSVRRSLHRTGPHWPSLIFLGLLAFSLLVTLMALLFLLVDILNRGLPVLMERGMDFLTSPLSSDPAKAGVSQALWGTIWIGVIVVIVAFPLGHFAKCDLRCCRESAAGLALGIYGCGAPGTTSRAPTARR